MEELKKKLEKFDENDYSIIVYLVVTLVIFYLIGIKDITNYWVAIGILILAYFFSRKSLHEYFIAINVIVTFLYVIVALVLQANPPVVAIVSCSMSHSNKERIELTHYKWLENNLGYSRDYINSFPFKNGFDAGDVGIVKKEKKYKVGEVIVFLKDNMKAPIIHRIIKINEDGTYQTKGDNNNAPLEVESSIKNNEIIGKVIFIIPKIGYLKLIITKILGIEGTKILC